MFHCSFIAFVHLIVFSLDVVPFNRLPDPSTVDGIPTDVRCDDLPHDMLFKPPLAPYLHHPPLFPSLKPVAAHGTRESSFPSHSPAPFSYSKHIKLQPSS